MGQRTDNVHKPKGKKKEKLRNLENLKEKSMRAVFSNTVSLLNVEMGA